MRISVAAALLVSPLMVHAQANVPAQPQAALHMPAALMLSSSTSSAADRPAVNTGGLKISTGVVEPKLIHTVPMHERSIDVSNSSKQERYVTVSMIVDQFGKPSDLKIVQSAGLNLDHDVLEAVSQYRYQPATVSGQVTSAPVNLHITILPGRGE